jgi:hypothetical protein
LTSAAPYVDSTSVAGDAARLRERFARDGYALIRGLLPEAAVLAVGSHVTACAREAGWLSGGVPNLTAERFHPVFLRMWSPASLHRLMHHHALLEAIGSLLCGQPVLVHPRKVLRFVLPVDGDSDVSPVAGPHQDFPELQGSVRQITAWTPLHRTEPSTGSLPLYPGSHLIRPRALCLASNPSGWAAEIDDLTTVHVGALDPGDVLLFSTFTVHGGACTSPCETRASVDARYQPLCDAISEKALGLVGLPYDWDAVYEGWTGGDLQYYWRRQPLRIAAHDPRWERWREQEALRRGALGDPCARQALRITASQGSSDRTRETAQRILRTWTAAAPRSPRPRPD